MLSEYYEAIEGQRRRGCTQRSDYNERPWNLRTHNLGGKGEHEIKRDSEKVVILLVWRFW